MKTLLVSAIAIASVLILIAAESPSLAAPRVAAPRSAAPTKTETFDVVKIGDEVKVIKKSELVGLRKSTAEEDKKDLKTYQDAKKELSKSKDKDKSAMPKKPVKRTVLVLKASFKTQEEAEAWKTKYEEKKDASKDAKKPGNS
jgi:hypothetical protein